MTWRIHHQAVTASTNQDARAGVPGDVFTADYQTAGRGRLNHTWHAAAGQNLMMSVVLDVAQQPPSAVATLPLVMGLAVIEALAPLLPTPPQLKWPNDVLVGGKKLCGILCERHGDCVIAGLGVNVRETSFPPEIADRATSLAVLGAAILEIPQVRDVILASLARGYTTWQTHGFTALLPRLQAVDLLKGRIISVLATDDDTTSVTGLCDGIQPDGALLVAGHPIYAGEAHILHLA